MKALNFPRAEDFESNLREVNHLACQIERLAPSEAGGRPNPEYPWPPPPALPVEAPVRFDFPLWRELQTNRRGIKFLGFLERLIEIFPKWYERSLA